MTLSEMRQILAQRELQLTKSLGQNFLHDGNQLRRIVAAAELTTGDQVLEIGPGLGPLTELLVAQAGKVLALEKDARLAAILQERFAATANLELRTVDALEVLRREARDWSAWKLVANLPYSVASPILVELAQSPQRPQRLVCTLQLEVAQRLMAGPDSDHYRLLTLLIQLDYEPRDWFKIPASCFFPAPEVDSACVVLHRRAVPLVTGEERTAFLWLIRQGFSQRRKMLRKLYKAGWPEPVLSAAFEKVGVPATSRAEALSLETFIALARQLKKPGVMVRPEETL